MLAHLQRDSIPQAAQTCFHSLAHSRRVQPAGQPPGEHTLTHKSARKAMRLAAPHDARNTRLFVPALDKVIEESEVEDDHTGDTSIEPSESHVTNFSKPCNFTERIFPSTGTLVQPRI